MGADHRCAAGNRIEPAPQRGQRTPWSTFLKAPWERLAATPSRQEVSVSDSRSRYQVVASERRDAVGKRWQIRHAQLSGLEASHLLLELELAQPRDRRDGYDARPLRNSGLGPITKSHQMTWYVSLGM